MRWARRSNEFLDNLIMNCVRMLELSICIVDSIGGSGCIISTVNIYARTEKQFQCFSTKSQTDSTILYVIVRSAVLNTPNNSIQLWQCKVHTDRGSEWMYLSSLFPHRSSFVKILRREPVPRAPLPYTCSLSTLVRSSKVPVNAP